jgi:hypothetical protein
MRVPLLHLIPRETIDLTLAAVVFIGLGLLGRATWGPDGIDVWGVFTLAGIAGATWGYVMGSLPLRKLRREWEEQVVGYREAPTLTGVGDRRDI